MRLERAVGRFGERAIELVHAAVEQRMPLRDDLFGQPGDEVVQAVDVGVRHIEGAGNQQVEHGGLLGYSRRRVSARLCDGESPSSCR